MFPFFACLHPLPSQDCPADAPVLSSDDPHFPNPHDPETYGLQNVLFRTDCEALGDALIVPDKAKYTFIVDIGCQDWVTDVELINTHNDQHFDR